MVNHWLNIKQHLTPNYCLLCQQRLDSKEQSGLCDSCLLDLPWLTSACVKCALPLKSVRGESLICGHCQKQPPVFSQTHALFHYQFPIDRLVSRLKFHQQLRYAKALGQLLCDHIRFQYQNQPLPDLLFPVPLHRKRLRERGFNQAQEIARVCSKELGIALRSDLCKRQKNTAHQPGLTARERRNNLKQAFTCQALKPGCRIALVDDVMTTGTTMSELTRCLLKAGCEEVHLWCIARAHYQ